MLASVARYKSKINGHSISIHFSYFTNTNYIIMLELSIFNIFTLFRFILNAMYMSVLPAYMNEQYMYAGPSEVMRGLKIHWNWN